jgi:hypothetical protein
MSVKSEEHPGHLQLVEVMRWFLKCVTEGCLRDVAEEEGIFYCSCQAILIENLEMRHVLVKFVPQLPTDEQKKTACLWLLTWLNMQRPMTVS